MKKTETRLVTLFFSVCLLLLCSQAMAATLDATFGDDASGVTVTDFMVGNDQAYAIAVQEDGKILAAGFTNAGQDTENTNIALVRYTSGGEKDINFGVDGEVIIDIGDNDAALAIALQQDGQMVLAGYGTRNGQAEIALVRVTSDGFNDPVFQNTAEASLSGLVDERGIAHGVVVQEDGRIVVAGLVGGAGSERAFVLRLNEDGSEDTDFGDGGIATVDGDFQSAAKALLLGGDGTIMLAGWKKVEEHTSANLLVFSASGTLDPSFGEGGSVSLMLADVDSLANALAVQPDGKIVLAGYADDGEGKGMLLVRYDENGLLDPEFGETGLVMQDLGYDNEIFDVVVGSDDSLYAVGYGYNDASDMDVLLIQTDVDGNLLNFSMVPTAGDESASSTIAINELQVDDGSSGIDTSEEDADPDSAVVLIEVGENDDTAQALLIQDDGAVLVAGFSNNGNNSDFTIMRFVDDISGASAETFVNSEYYRIGTEEVFNVTRNSAMTGGTVLSISSSAPGITGRGVAYGIVPFPVYRVSSDDSSGTDDTSGTSSSSPSVLPETGTTNYEVVRSGQTSDGTGTGRFGSDIFDITPDVQYYVRAYAILGDEDSTVIYGNQIVFTTEDACFIATAAYGSIFDNHVQVLREFRDVFLKGNVVGEKIIGWYYKWSPSAADKIADNPVLRAVTRIFLLPLVGVSHFMLYTGLAVKIMVMIGLLLLITFAIRNKLRISENV